MRLITLIGVILMGTAAFGQQHSCDEVIYPGIPPQCDAILGLKTPEAAKAFQYEQKLAMDRATQIQQLQAQIVELKKRIAELEKAHKSADDPAVKEIEQQKDMQRVYQQYDCSQQNRDVFDDFFREQKGCGQPRLIEKPVAVRP